MPQPIDPAYAEWMLLRVVIQVLREFLENRDGVDVARETLGVSEEDVEVIEAACRRMLAETSLRAKHLRQGHEEWVHMIARRN